MIADANERVQDQVQHFAHQVDGDGALRSVSTPSRRRIPAMITRHAPAGRVVVSAEAVEMGYRGLGAPDRGTFSGCRRGLLHTAPGCRMRPAARPARARRTRLRMTRNPRRRPVSRRRTWRPSRASEHAGSPEQSVSGGCIRVSRRRDLSPENAGYRGLHQPRSGGLSGPRRVAASSTLEH